MANRGGRERTFTDRVGQPDKPGLPAFRSAFPELSGRADADVSRMIDVAYQMSAVKTDATLYLAAHLLAIDAENTGGIDGGSGEIASETSVGGKLATYKTMAEKSGLDVFYSRTSYGRMFLAMERRTARRGIPILIA